MKAHNSGSLSDQRRRLTIAGTGLPERFRCGRFLSGGFSEGLRPCCYGDACETVDVLVEIVEAIVPPHSVSDIIPRRSLLARAALAGDGRLNVAKANIAPQEAAVLRATVRSGGSDEMDVCRASLGGAVKAWECFDRDASRAL